MKLTIFQSDKGDCLMLSAGGRRILVDGGMRDSYTRHVAPNLDKLRMNGEKLDLVYVSHIDRDHVFGILQMMEDLVAWRVYDFHQTDPGGNRNWPKPKVRRPPEIGGIWHNVFHELVGRNAGRISDMLAASTYVLSGIDARDLAESSDDEFDLTRLPETFQNLTSSMADAVELTRRVGPRQLGIPVNKEFGRKLILRRNGQESVRLGTMKIHVLGPSGSDLSKLRRKWNQWLKSEAGARQLRRIHREHRRDEEILEAADIRDMLALRLTLAAELGQRSKVTLPNLASLMLLVEQNQKTALLTGDGHSNDIISGLEHVGKIRPDAGAHFSVLKVPHHGSENNVTREFCRRVTADHYVFCGNGAHENPDLRVIDSFAKARIGGPRSRSRNREATNVCTFWFNSSSRYPHGKQDNLKHMRKIEKKMKGIERASAGRIKHKFLRSDSFEISI